jgi:hypothetical protein
MCLVKDVIIEERKAIGIGDGDKTLGIALSGGGIRSASFGLGVLQALNEKKVLKNAHYISTVSGGGYIGSAFTKYRYKNPQDVEFSNFFEDEPNDENKRFIRFLRHHGRYLTPCGKFNIISVLAVLMRSVLISAVIYFSVFTLIISVLGIIGQVSIFNDSYKMISEKVAPIFQYKSNVKTSKKTNINFKIFYENKEVRINKVDLVDHPEIKVEVTAKTNHINPSIWERRAFFRLAVDFAVLFLLLFIFWTLVVFLIGRKILYSFRNFSQKFQGILLTAFLVSIVFASIPIVPEFLQEYLKVQYKTVGTVGIISGLWAALARLRTHMGKTDVFKKSWIGNLLFRFGSIFFLYAMLILAYHWSLKLCVPEFVVDSIPWENFINTNLLISLLIIFAGFFFFNINDSTVASMYRDRLMEIFLPDKNAVKNNIWMKASEANDLTLDKMCKKSSDETKCSRPYHLINTNIILFGSKNVRFNNRFGDSFILSPMYCGSIATEYIETEKFNDKKSITLATAMATSGAAVNPRTGVAGAGPTCDLFVSIMMSVFNLRLGFWFANPKNIKPILRPNYLIPGVLSIFSRGHKENSSYIELSDGGHFENLGIYELVRRRVHTIIVSDASADKDFNFGDLANAIERIKADFGVIIRFEHEEEELGNLLPLSYKLPLNPPANLSRFVEKFEIAERGYAEGTIEYPKVVDDRSEFGKKFVGKIYLIKSTLLRNLPADLYGYRARNADFPDQTTGDQFFDENQFEAYRELGYRAAIPVAEILEKRFKN